MRLRLPPALVLPPLDCFPDSVEEEDADEDDVLDTSIKGYVRFKPLGLLLLTPLLLLLLSANKYELSGAGLDDADFA